MHVWSNGCSRFLCPRDWATRVVPVRRFRISVFSVGVVLLMTTSAYDAANGQTDNDTVAYSEDFDSGEAAGWWLNPGWEIQPVEDGFGLRGDGQGHAHSGYEEGVWTDSLLRCRVLLEGDMAHVSYRDAGESRYFLTLSASDIVLNKQTDPDTFVNDLASGSGISYGQWQTLEIDGKAATLTVSVDGVEILTYTDPDPLSAGGISFESFEAPFWLDDVEVLTPAPPAPPPGLIWIRTGGPPGGLGYDIRYKFGDPRTWYVTEGHAGLHISDDNGLTWSSSNEGITARTGRTGDIVPVFSATVDPHDSNIVWAGTQSTGDIYKSTDGGQSWVEMTNGIDERIASALSFRGFTVDPRGSAIVYAMGEIASPGWTADGSQRTGSMFDMTQGVVYRTTNGGEQWTEIWRGDNLARYCWIDPRDPDVLYVSTGIFDRDAANTDATTEFAGGVGIIKSTDGGETWRVLNQDNGLLDLYVGSLFMHPTNPDVLLAAATHDVWSSLGGGHTGGVFMTEDGGEHWERVVTPASGREEFTTVEICTADPMVAYAATTDAVYRSDDGGHTWQRFSNHETWGPPGILAGFPIDMQCDPRDPMRVFVNSYLGGNFLSTNGGETWITAAQGYTGAMVRHVVVAPGLPGTIVTGGRTGVLRTDDGGDTWTGLAYAPPELPDAKLAEIRALAVNPADADHLLAAPWDISNVVHSRDGGRSWHLASGLSDAGEGPVTLVFAPSSPSRVYAGLAPDQCRSNAIEALRDPGIDCDLPGMGFHVSDDGGATWSLAQGQQGRDTAVVALAVHPDDPLTVYASMPTAGVFKTSDGGQTWTPSGAGLPELPVLALTIDPSNTEIIFAGLAEDAVYRSTDAGVSWAQSAAGLNPTAEVHSVVVDPTDGQRVYAGDLLSGVYLSTDGGVTWLAVNTGLDQRSVNALAISDDGAFLYAGTEGGGVFRLDLNGEPPPATDWPGGQSGTPDDASGETPDNGGEQGDDAALIDEDVADEDSVTPAPTAGDGRTGGACGVGMILWLGYAPGFLLWKIRRRGRK